MERHTYLEILLMEVEQMDEELCEECFHPIRLHGKYGCEEEHDQYEAGYAPMAVMCGCQEASNEYSAT